VARADDHPIPERVRLVIALTEVNSRHLSGESRRNGLEIVLARVLEDAARAAAPAGLAERMAMLREDLAVAEAALALIEEERARLYAALDALDGALDGSGDGKLDGSGEPG